MNIIIFIGSLSGGGAERVTANLANYLCEKGNEVAILNFEQNESKYALDERVSRFYLVQNHRSSTYSKVLFYFFNKQIYGFRLKKFLKKLNNKVDAYVVMLEHPTILLLEKRKYVKCPIIVSERNYPGIYPAYFQKKLLKLSKKANGYVFQTDEAKKWYGQNISNSCIIPNAINQDFLNIPRYLGKRKKKIVSVGRLTEQKNHTMLIEAFSLIKNKEYILEIYGEGPLKEKLANQIKELKLENRVFLKGFKEDIGNVIYDASIFVMTSINEGLPNSLIEAMALGLPCITTNFAGGGAKTIIDNGMNGIILDDYDSRELAATIDMLLDNRNLSEKLSNNATLKVKEFKPNYIYQLWLEYIFKVIKGDNCEKNC